MVRWVVRSILHGEPIELFLIPASAPCSAQAGNNALMGYLPQGFITDFGFQRPWYVLSCLWGGAYKRTLDAKWKE